VVEGRRAIQAAACLLVFFLPLGVAPAEILLAVGLLLVGARALADRHVDPSPLDLPLLVLLCTALLAAIASEEPLLSLRATVSLWTVAAFYLGRAAATDARSVARVWICLALGASLAALAALFQVGLGAVPIPADWVALGFPAPALRDGRATGWFGHPLTFAGQQAMVILGLAAIAATRGRRLGSACRWALPLPLLAAGLIASAARGAFASAVAGLLTLACWGRGARRGLMLTAGAVALGCAGLTLGALLAQRLAAPGSAEVPGRTAMWQVAIDIWREHPLLGAGPGAFRRLAPERLDISRYRPAHAHSTPLHLLAETGFVGLAAFIALWVRFFVALRRRTARVTEAGEASPSFAAASGIAVAAFLAMGIVEHNFGDAEVVMLAFFLAGLPFGPWDTGPSAG
jgi:O-antigen ligase